MILDRLTSLFTSFSFIGTVLGILIWNAAILHARWGGIPERSIMNMAIFGNIVTVFSWFGVNMLGVGLHSYGFMDAAFKWLMLFIGSQLVLILLGSAPLQFWKSFREPSAVSALAGKSKSENAIRGKQTTEQKGTSWPDTSVCSASLLKE